MSREKLRVFSFQSNSGTPPIFSGLGSALNAGPRTLSNCSVNIGRIVKYSNKTKPSGPNNPGKTK